MVRRKRVSTFFAAFSIGLTTLCLQAQCADHPPADAILPDTTKLYLSIKDLDDVLQKWQQTAAGRLVQRPELKPFIDDVWQQFQANLSLVRRLGTDWSELKQLEIRSIDWAIVQPENDAEQVAVAFVGTVADGSDAEPILAGMLARLQAGPATLSEEMLAGRSVQVVSWPKQGRYDRERRAFFLADGATILASDRQATLAGMIARKTNESASLRQFKPYAEIMKRCTLASLKDPDLRWFVEPFGFAETLRANNGGRRKRGSDFLKILPRQGFSAIQGVGGLLRLHYLDFDNLAQAYIYAPAAPGQPVTASGDRFVNAAKMLSFPNRRDAAPLDWIPADVGSYITLRCKLGEAFEHSKSLVDDLASQPVFEDVLKSIELDPNGPQVDLRKAFVQHLGERLVVLTEAKPATSPEGTPQGGRMAGIAVELTDSTAVEQSLNKIMDQDPNAQRLEHLGKILWVMSTASQDDAGGGDFGSFDSFDIDEDLEDDRPQLFPNRIFFVAHDHLIVTTNEAFAKKLLQPVAPKSSLAQDGRHLRVRHTLADLGAAEDCFRFFIRTAKLVESSYRKLRTSEKFDLFDNFGLLMEKVWVSGEKLPPYEGVATELGDSGVYVHSEVDGWRIVGFLLKNETSE